MAMDRIGERQESLREEGLGRVAKVAAEPSCLGCTGLPSAQRDAGYRSEGFLSSDNLGGRLLRSLTWVLMESKCAPVRTPPLERARRKVLVGPKYGGGIISGVVASVDMCAAHRNRSAQNI